VLWQQNQGIKGVVQVIAFLERLLKCLKTKKIDFEAAEFWPTKSNTG